MEHWIQNTTIAEMMWICFSAMMPTKNAYLKDGFVMATMTVQMCLMIETIQILRNQYFDLFDLNHPVCNQTLLIKQTN